MKQKIMFILVCIVFALFVPYIFTMMINGKHQEDIYEVETSGKTVIITENGSQSKLDVEEFIPCVLMSQLSIDSEEEALKAQAVIIRTYILKEMGELTEISADELNLPYLTYTEMQKTWDDDFTTNYNKVIKIVEKTGLEVIKYNGNLITPYYHEASVGSTRNGTEVLGSEEYSYLQSVESLQDVEAKNYLSIKYFTKEELISKLKAYNSSITLDAATLLDSIVINKKCSAGYALEIKVGNITMTGEEFAACLELNSSFFTIEEYESEIRIITKGIGHGLGLSLYGAEALAEEGNSYKDILLYYYKNIVIESV